MFRRALIRIAAVAVVVGPACALTWVSGATGSTLYVSPGQAWSQALSQAGPGDTVVVRNGTYPRQTITQRFSDDVRVVGESTTGVTVQGLNLTSGASHLVLSGMTVTTAGSSDTQSAIKIYGGSNNVALQDLVITPLSHAGVEVHNWGGAPHDIRISNSTISGQRSSATTTGRNVWIGDLNGGDSTTWPTNIELLNNDLGYASADAVHISGGTGVTLAGNEIHDLKATDDHNDGVQSVASNGLRIIGNRISSPGTWTCSTCVPPDQGIIVGNAYPATTYKKVTNTYIADNIIHHWRGKGLMVTGTSDTSVVNNTVTRVGLPGTTTAAALTVAEPYGYTNSGLRIWNNIIDRLAVAVTVPVSYIGHNCIREGLAGEQAVSGDPRFSDVTREFTLAADSPCLAMGVRGTSWETPTVDFAGLPLDDPADLGARQLARSERTTAEAPTDATTEPTTTTTTPAPEPSPVSQEPAPVAVDVTVIFSGAFGHRGNSRTHELTTSGQTLTASLELPRGAAATVEIYGGDGARLFSQQVGDGESFSLPIDPGTHRVVVSATNQLKYALAVTYREG